MEIPIWATHVVSWKHRTHPFKVCIGEGQYQYVTNPFGNLKRYDHSWGVKEWIANVEKEEGFTIEPVFHDLENK